MDRGSGLGKRPELLFYDPCQAILSKVPHTCSSYIFGVVEGEAGRCGAGGGRWQHQRAWKRSSFEVPTTNPERIAEMKPGSSVRYWRDKSDDLQRKSPRFHLVHVRWDPHGGFLTLSRMNRNPFVEGSRSSLLCWGVLPVTSGALGRPNPLNSADCFGSIGVDSQRAVPEVVGLES